MAGLEVEVADPEAASPEFEAGAPGFGAGASMVDIFTTQQLGAQR